MVISRGRRWRSAGRPHPGPRRRRRGARRACSAPRRSPRSGLLLAGTLRAEATLAAANLVYLLLLAGGAVVLPTSSYGGFGDVAALAALGRARRRDARSAFLDGAVGWRQLACLLGWAVARHGADREDVPVGVTACPRAWLRPLAWATLVANIGSSSPAAPSGSPAPGSAARPGRGAPSESFTPARRARRPRGHRVRQPDADLRARRRRRRHAGRPRWRHQAPRPARAGASSSPSASPPRR